jgi:tRNA 2-thiouridine synthesizing protein A
MHPMRLDLSGLKCPLPVLRTRKALARMAEGQEIEVIATDPISGIDIPHFCASEGHEIISQKREAPAGAAVRISFLIRKGSSGN